MNLNDATNIQLPSLSERAILIRLSRSMYQPYALDVGQTMKVELDTGVRKAGRFNKRLFLDCCQLRDTNAAFHDVYSYHMRNSAPWLDDGVRVIPSQTYFDYMQGMRELIDKANYQADMLASQWDRLVQDDMARLGPLANADDYPKDIRSKYKVSIKPMPVPEVGDFRVQISDDDKKAFAEALHEAEAGVTKHLLEEMLEPVKKAVEKLSIPIGAEGSIFRDTLIGNLSDVAQRARKLNLTRDTRINELVDEINAAIGGYTKSADRLRESDEARSQARAKLDGIMSKMGAFYS